MFLTSSLGRKPLIEAKPSIKRHCDQVLWFGDLALSSHASLEIVLGCELTTEAIVSIHNESYRYCPWKESTILICPYLRSGVFSSCQVSLETADVRIVMGKSAHLYISDSSTSLCLYKLDGSC
jgi:hypothetical protein